MRKIVLVCAITAYFLFPQLANAQSGCTGQAAGGTLCGNNTASQGLPTFKNNPVLGIPGTSSGQLGFAGSASGTATIVPQAISGSPTLTLPNTSGTFADGATSPIVLSPTTGNISCPTCLTGGGGSLIATAPLNITGSTISLQGGNGTIAQGSNGTGSTFTITPSLGVPGSSTGTLTFANTTSGFVEFVPASGALGASVITLPAITDTMAGKALANGGTNASLTASNGGIVWSNASQLQILGGTVTARQMLQSGATATPAWSTATWPATTTINQLLYSSSANTVAGLSTANGGVLNTSSSGVPSVTATPVLGVAGSTVGTEGFQNATSGTITVSPPTGALGTVTNTLQAATDTFVYRATTDTLTNKTYSGGTLTGSIASGGATLTGNITLSGVPVLSGLASGTCTNGLAINSGNSIIEVACPGVATTITVGTTTIGSGTSGAVLYDNSGTLGNATITGPLQLTGGAFSINGTNTAHGLTIWEGTSAMGNTGAGTVGQYVASSGASADPTMTSGPWTLLATLTASNSATLSDTTHITSTYTDYEIVCRNLLPATNAVTTEFQVHSSGSFQTSGYSGQSWLPNGTAIITNSWSTFGFLSNASSVLNTGGGASFRIMLQSPSTSNIHPITGLGLYTVSGPVEASLTIGGVWNTSGVVDGFQILESSGNITSGVCELYGRL